uniref:U3 small nucleolar RNA-associated protein 25 homolog isoform X1 n=2 Tax=Myxine glutinosa TaxID=7769 RepID=UPI00358E8A69
MAPGWKRRGGRGRGRGRTDRHSSSSKRSRKSVEDGEERRQSQDRFCKNGTSTQGEKQETKPEVYDNYGSSSSDEEEERPIGQQRVRQELLAALLRGGNDQEENGQWSTYDVDGDMLHSSDAEQESEEELADNENTSTVKTQDIEVKYDDKGGVAVKTTQKKKVEVQKEQSTIVKKEGMEFFDQNHEAEFSLNIEAKGSEDEEEKEDIRQKCEVNQDLFLKHMEFEMDEKVASVVLEKTMQDTVKVKWPVLGQMCISSSLPGHVEPPARIKSDVGPTCLHLSRPLSLTWLATNRVDGKQAKHRRMDDRSTFFTSLQGELFSILNSYRDLLYTERMATVKSEEIRRVYCLHALNHVLKANARVLANNRTLRKRAEREKETRAVTATQKRRLRMRKAATTSKEKTEEVHKVVSSIDDDDKFRDQGFTRPKVLIVLPTRDAALRCVRIFMDLLRPVGEKFQVGHQQRFLSEYGREPDDIPPNLSRPDDFLFMFSGNTDDHFRVGLAVLQRKLRLYSPFYSSDVIIASPLGLRTILGVEGEKQRDFDFLSSIELLVLDQTDMLLMQNWEHVTHLMSHLNRLPLESQGIDFSRVRNWMLHGWASRYRQTVVLSAMAVPQILAIFNHHCHNYRGQVLARTPPKMGSITQVLAQVPHAFHRLESQTYSQLPDIRFQHFVEKVLPQYRDAVMSHTMIFVPSYFDYLRLQNHFEENNLECSYICEYKEGRQVGRARRAFRKGHNRFMLYTERFHFFKRYTIQGVHHLVFYDLPTYPGFYSEVCNMLLAGRAGVQDAGWTCTVLYSRFDALRLAAVVGSERAAQMIASSKSVHLFVTGDTVG